MRKRFHQGNELDAIRIEDVKIYTKSRHELPPLLLALQHLFVTPVLNEAVFEILDRKLQRNKLGREGMSHWEILVLGTVRLNMDIDYDFLLDQANNHSELRGILGVETRYVFRDKKMYKLQTIKDNVSLLDEETLIAINALVVKAGHNLLKKNESEDDLELELKADTFPVEINIHFPTDINLLWDSVRKCLDLIIKLSGIEPMKGLRQSRHLRKRLKSSYLLASNIHRKKGKNYEVRLSNAVENYLDRSRGLLAKIDENHQTLIPSKLSRVQEKLWEELTYYTFMLDKHIDLVDRRLLKGEKIPHQEKVFSIFEPETEWLSKGKRDVDLGHNVLVCTDQYNFIVNHKVAIRETDKTLAIPLKNELVETFGEHRLKSISFDRGFYSLKAKKELAETFDKVVMPKTGKKSKKVQEEEAEECFVLLKNSHCAVESNINELEHAGVNKVPDRGTEAFKRYVALGVLAYNLKRLGKMLAKQQKENSSDVTVRKKYKNAA